VRASSVVCRNVYKFGVGVDVALVDEIKHDSLTSSDHGVGSGAYRVWENRVCVQVAYDALGYTAITSANNIHL